MKKKSCFAQRLIIILRRSISRISGGFRNKDGKCIQRQMAVELPYVDQAHSIPIQRSPFHLHNRLAYVELKKLLEKEHYQFIHCHTPMGSVIGRLAAKTTRKKGTKVLYTAHGFHFWKGAPLQNWLLYYPVERWLVQYTDALITINGEDYERADRLSKEKAAVHYVPGMGVDMKRFAPVDDTEKDRLRKAYGFTTQDFIVLCLW